MGLLCFKSRSQRRFKMSVNACPDIFWNTEYFGAKFGMVMQHYEPECHAKNLLLLQSSRSRSQRGLIWSEYDSFYYSVWTVYSLANKLGLMIHQSLWKVKMLMFVQMVSSKLLNILFPNLVLWLIIMRWSVMQKDWFAIFRFKVTARAHMIKIWQFLLYLLNC